MWSGYFSDIVNYFLRSMNSDRKVTAKLSLIEHIIMVVFDLLYLDDRNDIYKYAASALNFVVCILTAILLVG